MVEAAVSIGGRDARPGITAYRFANRIPLLFEVRMRAAFLAKPRQCGASIPLLFEVRMQGASLCGPRLFCVIPLLLRVRARPATFSPFPPPPSFNGALSFATPLRA